MREVDVGQVFQDASVIHGGMAICDLDVAPAFERSKHHEEIGGAIALARSTMPSSTTVFSNSRKVQRARPLGGLEQAKAISLASFSPSKIRATAGIARGLRLSTASKPSSTSCLRTQ